MPSSPIQFRFADEPEDRSNQLDAYNAGQALWGISRSLAIVTHYAINRRVIKQGPALYGARVYVAPPRAGSFEYLINIAPVAAEIATSVSAAIIYDLAKLLYRRASGLSEKPDTPDIAELLQRVPGDIDALNDAVDEDVVRFHRPFEGPVSNLVVHGGTVNIGTFNRGTYWATLD